MEKIPTKITFKKYLEEYPKPTNSPPVPPWKISIPMPSISKATERNRTKEFSYNPIDE